MLGFDAEGRLAVGQLPFSTAAGEPIEPVVWQPSRRVSKRAVIACMVSGMVAGPLNLTFPTVDKYLIPFSEPIRLSLKKETHPSRAPFSAFVPGAVSVVEASWYAPLSEPVRLKPGLGAYLQDYQALEVPVVTPAFLIMPWFSWLSEPVRLPEGLKAWLQRDFFAPPRLLPTPTITATMAWTEVNNDQWEIVYTNDASGGGAAVSAKVSITEVDNRSAVVSLRES